MFDELAAKQQQQGNSGGPSSSASGSGTSIGGAFSGSGGVNVAALAGVRFGHVHAGAVPRGEGLVPADDPVPYVGGEPYAGVCVCVCVSREGKEKGCIQLGARPA